MNSHRAVSIVSEFPPALNPLPAPSNETTVTPVYESFFLNDLDNYAIHSNKIDPSSKITKKSNLYPNIQVAIKYIKKIIFHNRTLLSLFLGAIIVSGVIAYHSPTSTKTTIPLYFQPKIKPNINKTDTLLVTEYNNNPAVTTPPEIAVKFNDALHKELDKNKKPLFSLPVSSGILTSIFGMRWGTLHAGIDIANSIGTPIKAVADGEVIDAGPAAGFGLWVRLLHNDGTITVYGHVNTITVSKGQQVMAGDEIATMGNRGYSTGPHLHFEVWLNGSIKIDPIPWLAARGLFV